MESLLGGGPSPLTASRGYVLTTGLLEEQVGFLLSRTKKDLRPGGQSHALEGAYTPETHLLARNTPLDRG